MKRKNEILWSSSLRFILIMGMIAALAFGCSSDFGDDDNDNNPSSAEQTGDSDGDGYTEVQGDCSDTDANIHPGATEICGDGTDQDCDGSDLACAADPADTDDDGDGHTENQGDCNDDDAGIHPGAAEICGDETDQDCDGNDLACSDEAVSRSVKARMKPLVLSVNNLLFQTAEGIYAVIEDIVREEGCDFSVSVSHRLTINGSPHDTYLSGEARLYNNGRLLNCDDLLYSDIDTLHSAEAEGTVYINGDEITSTFEGQFSMTGSEGYLVRVTDDIYASDYFFINGSGVVEDIVYEGTEYPNFSGDVSNVKVDKDGMVELAISSDDITLGDLARVTKDGYIYGQSPDCDDITIHFNGTNLVDVSSSCTSPSEFKLDVDTGDIVE